jgi:preprotein translocase subunit SecD
MSLETVCKAIQTHLDAATANPVSVGMRRPNTQTPAVVWEISAAQASRAMPGTDQNLWLVTVEVNIYGDTTLAVAQEADKICAQLNGVETAAGTADIVCTDASVAFRTESQADGSEGDERVCTLTLSLQGI